MFAAKVSFAMGNRDAESTAEEAQDLLGCWYKNGQILGNSWVFTASSSAVEIYVTIPEENALESVHNNIYVTHVLDGIRAKGLPVPLVSVLGPDPSLPAACACKSSSALVLFTHYLTDTPPVRCLDCFQPVPLYRLPQIQDEEHLGFLQWAADYQACDTLQMHCTTGERFGEAQLSRHDSQLSRNGRDLCTRLERAMGTPVYYFLFKMRSRGRKSELARKCPSCGADWRLTQQLHLFDFRCDSCRLLSAVAADAS